MARYLGIDVGTTKIAAVVVDTATGLPVAIQAAENDSRRAAGPGRSEWDADQVVTTGLVVAQAAIAAAGPPAIAAIGVTGQMHGMLLVGGDGRPVTPFIGWQDRRGDEPLGGFPTAIAWLRHLAGPDAPRRAGCAIATGYLGASLFWLHRAGQMPAGAALASTLPDYLVARLTGQPPLTDPTNAGGTGLFNARARRWDDDLLAALDLPPSLLPTVRPTGTLVGGLTAAAAAALGLPTGLPVANALGDNQASFVGSVAHPDDDLLVNVGTGGQVSAAAGLVAPPGRLETRPFVDDRALLVGAGEIGGTAYRQLRDFIRQVGLEVFGAEVDDLYPVLNRLAAAVPPGSDGLTCDPRFVGTRVDPTRRGGFSGLGAGTFTPGHLARAVLEGVAEVFWSLAEEMRAAGLPPRRRLIGSGNGIRRNPVLAAVLAARFQAPLVTPAHTEEAAFGAALLASVATGELDLAGAGALIRYTVP